MPDTAARLELTIGPEFDADFRRRLKTAVQLLGGSIGPVEWSVAGSQEISTYSLEFPEGTLHATEETYMGLSIKGDDRLVNALVNQLPHLTARE